MMMSAPIRVPERRCDRLLLRSLCALLCLFCSVGHAFEMQTIDAERTNLLDRVGHGRWVLVQFWAIDCIPCEEQKPMLDDFHRTHSDSAAEVIGVALDGLEQRDQLLAIIERHDASYDNLVVFTDVYREQFSDLTGQAFRATPTYLLFDPDGGLHGVHVGPVSRASLDAVVTGGP